MAQPGINAKIEELQFRIKTDPRSRLFFPLAEELRKNGRLPEAEQVLRTGLGVHATYLSAWVSLGRVLREQHKNAEAVDALNTAMQVDPGNVVAARLLADAYFDLGEKVEAIKKYKLVHALMPSDEELEAKIEQIERDLQAAAPAPFAPVEDAQPEAAPQDDDVTATTTMADLYVRQGLINEARKIYEHLLQRDPYDDDVRTKLDALDRRVAELPDDQVAEETATESEEATWRPDNATMQ